MTTVPVRLAEKRGYDIVIAPGCAVHAPDEAADAGKRLYVFDRNTEALFASRFPDDWGAHFTFGCGEAAKNPDSLIAICRAALCAGIDRKGCFVAVGGGVTGDLTAFAAGIYLRGVRCIQVPTTLLAMVDSGVGGKSAVDLPEGKNLIGLFHQPSAVWIDPEFLRTLPVREMRGGLAEVVKMAAGFDPELFSLLEKHASNLTEYGSFAPLAEEVIGRCCQAKAAVVAADECEKSAGGRELLNFGHTYGHAIESGAEFALSHGESVAIGMVLAGQAALNRDLWSRDLQMRLISLLKAIGLPVTPPDDLKFDELLTLMRRDKKNRAGQVTLILPETLGKLTAHPDFGEAELREAWRQCGGKI